MLLGVIKTSPAFAQSSHAGGRTFVFIKELPSQLRMNSGMDGPPLLPPLRPGMCRQEIFAVPMGPGRLRSFVENGSLERRDTCGVDSVQVNSSGAVVLYSRSQDETSGEFVSSWRQNLKDQDSDICTKGLSHLHCQKKM